MCLEFTMKRLDHLYFNHKDTWPNHHMSELAFDLIAEYNKKGVLIPLYQILAENLVEIMLSRPEYVPDHMDEDM